jgi:hypothetical protein
MLSLRVAPFLKFHIDENLKKELAMMDLLDKVARENAEIDRRRAEQGVEVQQQEPSQQDQQPE